MGSLGPLEIGLIFLAILLLFGAKRIPEIARGLGKGIREFKSATQDIKREINDVGSEINRIDHPRQTYQSTAPRGSQPAQPAQPSQPTQPEQTSQPSQSDSVPSGGSSD